MTFYCTGKPSCLDAFQDKQRIACMIGLYIYACDGWGGDMYVYAFTKSIYVAIRYSFYQVTR